MCSRLWVFEWGSDSVVMSCGKVCVFMLVRCLMILSVWLVDFMVLGLMLFMWFFEMSCVDRCGVLYYCVFRFEMVSLYM